jgi:hypothetical protein
LTAVAVFAIIDSSKCCKLEYPARTSLGRWKCEALGVVLDAAQVRLENAAQVELIGP